MSAFGWIGTLSGFADAVERRFPALSWNRWGDPISWTHHWMWAALGTGAAWLVGHAHVGAWVMLAFYVLREGISVQEKWRAWRDGTSARGPFVDRTIYRPTAENGWVVQRGLHAGFLVDSFMDCMGPALLVWLTS